MPRLLCFFSMLFNSRQKINCQIVLFCKRHSTWLLGTRISTQGINCQIVLFCKKTQYMVAQNPNALSTHRGTRKSFERNDPTTRPLFILLSCIICPFDILKGSYQFQSLFRNIRAFLDRFQFLRHIFMQRNAILNKIGSNPPNQCATFQALLSS